MSFASGPSFGQTFVFHLGGDQEVPPVSTTASGGCFGELDQIAGEFALTCSHSVVGATVMHIHRAPAGANGLVVFDLGDPASPVQATWTGMTPADIADLLSGDLYVNIHTAGRPAGEIRGQILVRTVDTVPFTADGSQNVPPNTTASTATCIADLNNPATELSVQCTHDVPSPIAAHVHSAPAGQSGPVVFTFGSPASPLSANVPLTPLLVADFAATFLYLDVHIEPSESSPGGDIRGQIGVPPAVPTTGTIRITKSTSPPGGTGFGFTHDIPSFPGTFTLDDGQTQTFADVPAGSYAVTEDDPTATPGGFALNDVECDDANSTGNPFTRTAAIQLDPGEVVTCTFQNFQTTGADSIFVFDLRGAQEVPPVASTLSGGCMGLLDSVAGELWLICTHNVVEATVMHIHGGAAGINGPPIFELGDPTSPVQATWTGMTPADVADLLAGNLYVNIHTAGRPAGEIRGQILVRTVDMVNFTANGSQNVPPTSTAATATCSADLNNPATELFVQCSHDIASPTDAHVHSAPAGQNGPVAFTFGSPASPFSANVPLTPRLVADFAATFLYVDIHTPVGEDTPSDDIRGQIGVPPAAPTTGTIRVVKTTYPAGGAGFGFTHDIPTFPGSFTLDDGQTEIFANVAGGTYIVTENDPGPGGFALTDVECDDANSSGDPFARAATIQLDPGELVTCVFRNVQVSGSPQIFVFHLSGDQEVPPVPSPASGGCMGLLNAGAAQLSLVCTHNVTGATVMHVHRGAAGANGPPVFDFGNPSSPVQATWTGMTPADIADLLAGNLYVNIHASGRPDGEIRGQMLPRTVDNFAFPMNGGQQVPPNSSAARGSCFVDLNDGATGLQVSCTHSLAGATAAHLHSAPPGAVGPVAFSFDPNNPFAANVPMTPRLVADFAAGFLYVDLHTTDSPDGEIRGQLVAAAQSVLEIPTVSEWGLILLALSMAALAWRRLAVHPGDGARHLF
ncbi:MAG TPA: CHRD domain-containing protein [Thermoanaerobaculia bacterium]